MYATGTPTSLSDFLNALATFAGTAGWTVDHNGAVGASDYYLAVHKNGCYLGYYVANVAAPPGTLQIELYGATGYASATLPAAQAGASPQFSLLYPPPVGPYTAYHFFSTATSGINYLHSILEYSAGNFLHIHGGTLNPVGGASLCTYTAGTQWAFPLTGGASSGDGGPTSGNFTPFSGESNNGSFRAVQLLCTVDGTQRWFAPTPGGSPARLIGALRSGSRNVNAFNRAPNTYNQLAPFIPLSLYVERAVGNIYSYAGDVIDLRWVNIKNNQAKDEITIGADTWKLFPVISKQPFGSASAATSNYGFAFRKNA